MQQGYCKQKASLSQQMQNNVQPIKMQNQWKNVQKTQKKMAKTIDTRASHVLTHRTTDLA
jgi:hypothetical protein